MGTTVQIEVSELLSLRDPNDTALGRKIVRHGIELIHELGLEKFTFKKLAEYIESTEASVYRYFESKHQFLLYLVSLYWNWVSYRIDYKSNNVNDPEERLKIILQVLTESTEDDPATVDVDEGLLHRIVISESAKAFLTTQIEGGKPRDLFEGFYGTTDKFATVISQVNPKYPKPRALATSLIVIAHRQLFWAEHLPNLSDLKVRRNNQREILEFLEKTASALLS